MYKVISKKRLAPKSYMMEIYAPHVAKSRKPGQFVIFRVDEKGERFPLTIADGDEKNGTIKVIFQAVGVSTHKLAMLGEGDYIRDVAGPLGNPTPIENYGKAVVVGGGFGTAVTYPIVRALKEAGNYVIVIIGFRTKSLIFMDDILGEYADELHIATDDGSFGRKGFVTDVLRDVISMNDGIGFVMAIGPVVMMKAVSELTKPHNIKTYVSLNPIMVDGTGMCGACRVTVGGETKFVCIDGPDFDAHLVDFNELMMRLGAYKDLEQESMQIFKEKYKEAVDKI
jgi:ferredoxin--NADP+ reductase